MQGRTFGAIALAAACAWPDDGRWSALREGWLNHPRLDAAREDAKDAKNDASRAGLPPPWRLELSVQDFAGTGDRAGFGGSSQEFWAAREIRLRPVAEAERALARGSADLVAADTLLVRREILFEGRRRWEEWARSKRMVALLDSQIGEARQWLATARREKEAGRTPAWQEHQLAAELAGLEGRRRAAALDASASWKSALAPGDASKAEPEAPPASSQPEGAVAADVPDSVLLEARLRLAVAARVLADAASGPVLDASGGVLRDQASGELGLGVRVSVPVSWGREDWQRAVARSAVRAAERGRKVAESERERRRRDLALRIGTARGELADHERNVLPALGSARDRVEAAWAAGAAGWLERKSARAAWWEARARALELESAVRDLELERMAMEGVEP